MQPDCERLHSDTIPPVIVSVTESSDSILHRRRNGGGGHGGVSRFLSGVTRSMISQICAAKIITNVDCRMLKC